MSEATIEKTKIDNVIYRFVTQIQKQMPLHFNKQRKRVIVLSGPTCSGKTALSLELAQAINGEIISADSMQVYRGMDIGTAKATREERLFIPHHMIDIRDLCEGFNVVDFYVEARQACQEVLDRGSVPIVVGGSGFYLHSFLYGPPSGPPSVPELTKQLEDEMESLGSGVLYQRLANLDPYYAKSITKNDKQKIVRGLEIIALTQKPVSSIAWKGRRKLHHFDFQCWFLNRPTEILYQRINDRCDQMLCDGFLDEVKRLIGMGLCENSSASQAIGYRQALDFLKTDQSPADYAHFVTQFKQATRHYAKRQRTWFRKEPFFEPLDMEALGLEGAFEIVKKNYERL